MQKRLKIEVDKVCIDFERGRRVPNVRISAVYKFLQVQFRRAHIAQGQIVHFLLVLLLQYCKQVGKQRKVLCFEVRAVGRFGDAFSLIRFHDEIIDEFDNVRARAHKNDFEETFKHFQVRIERNRRLGGRSVLRQYLIDMERIDSAFFRVADVYQIARQIFVKVRYSASGSRMITLVSFAHSFAMSDFKKNDLPEPDLPIIIPFEF